MGLASRLFRKRVSRHRLDENETCDETISKSVSGNIIAYAEAQTYLILIKNSITLLFGINNKSFKLGSEQADGRTGLA